MSFFDKTSKAKNILELFTYDIVSFFYNEYDEVDSEDTESIFMAVYEHKLPWIELGCFDTIQFRVFFDKHSFTGSNPINVRFYSKNTKPTFDSMKNVINNIHMIYGNDDDQRVQISNEEQENINKTIWNRRWTIEGGESFLTTNLSTSGFELKILFLNNLIKHTGKYLNIKK